MAPQRNGMIAMITAGLLAVGTIGGAVWTMEVRYAKESELVQHVQTHQQERRDLNFDVIETRRQVIRKGIFELERNAKERRLTADEQRYLDELRLQEQAAKDRLDRLK